MKSILLSTVVALSIWSPANAASKVLNELPQIMQGDWCFTQGRSRVGDRDSYSKGKCDEKEEDAEGRNATLNSIRFDSWETECNIDKIREIVRGKSYTLEMKCVGEGAIWNERVNFTIVTYNSETMLIPKKEWTSTPQY
jgi:hypothetical protein